MRRLLLLAALLFGFTTIGCYAQKHKIVRPKPKPAATTPVKKPTINKVKAKIYTPEAVDLGLSVKWASFNLGARRPEQTGYYYKWGETMPADKKGWANYKYARGNYDRLTKYNDDSEYGYKGFIDHRTKLEPADDAATANLGGKWRMPTKEEIVELMHKCKKKETTRNGTKGFLITGPNGNSIFLPYAGYINYDPHYGPTYKEVGAKGQYWSSSLSYNRCSWFFFIDSRMPDYIPCTARAYGLTVRPVLP